MLIPLMIGSPYRGLDESRVVQLASQALIGLVNLFNMASLALLVKFVVDGQHINGTRLILSAAQIWLTNVIVFSLWYWELDRGGPGLRVSSSPALPDFLFPQMTEPAVAPKDWRPAFIDYLYVAFTNATAFSPTDTMPLTPRSKTLMLVQALISLVTIAIVAAHAVNIIR